MNEIIEDQHTMNHRIFLRDACILGCGDDIIARMKRCSELAREHGISVQFTLDSDLVDDMPILKQISEIMNMFETVLLHLHCRPHLRFGKNRFTSLALSAVQRLSEKNSFIAGICVHPDLVADFSALTPFILPGAYVGIEILDMNACCANTFDEFKSILDEHPFLQPVLDTAHIQGMESGGEPSLESYITYFGDNIREIHVSQWGNFYDPGRMEESFTTDHSHFAAASGGKGIPAILSRLVLPHFVIEGVIPEGTYGEELVAREVEMLRRAIGGA